MHFSVAIGVSTLQITDALWLVKKSRSWWRRFEEEQDGSTADADDDDTKPCVTATLVDAEGDADDDNTAAAEEMVESDKSDSLVVLDQLPTGVAGNSRKIDMGMMNNVFMQLRKVANHSLLNRAIYQERYVLNLVSCCRAPWPQQQQQQHNLQTTQSPNNTSHID
jgi:hypothetical protein